MSRPLNTWNWNEKPNGNPKIGKVRGELIEIKSATSGGKSYIVDIARDTCIEEDTGLPCPDHFYRKRRCKHILLAFAFTREVFKPKTEPALAVNVFQPRGEPIKFTREDLFG